MFPSELRLPLPVYSPSFVLHPCVFRQRASWGFVSGHGTGHAAPQQHSVTVIPFFTVIMMVSLRASRYWWTVGVVPGHDAGHLSSLVLLLLHWPFQFRPRRWRTIVDGSWAWSMLAIFRCYCCLLQWLLQLWPQRWLAAAVGSWACATHLSLLLLLLQYHFQLWCHWWIVVVGSWAWS